MKNQLMLASAIVIAAAAPAAAFDTVTWNWNADVISTVTTNAVGDVVVAPTGLEQVESEQTALGDFAATSSTLGVTNDVISLSGLTLDDVVAVETTASALGNSAALESDVSVQYDSSQTFGGVDLTLGTGLLEVSLPGTLLATSTTTGVINGTVDSDATSVANNFTADLVTTSDQDAFLLGNNVQTAFATIGSTSLVDVVSFTDVSGLGTLVDPAVSSVSTSVGNNIGVTIDGIN